MDKLLTEHDKQVVDTGDFLDMVSFRNQQHNILNLRKIVGDEKYLLLMDKFAGSYTRFPTAKNALETVDDLMLIHLWNVLQEMKQGGDLERWNQAEKRFIVHGQKMGMNYRNAGRRARSVTKELITARLWANNHEKQKTTVH